MPKIKGKLGIREFYVDRFIISGKVIDKDSKNEISDIRIKVDGVTQFGFGRRVEVGHTFSEADGTFNLVFTGIEKAAFYDFFANRGSSDEYTEETDYHGAFYLDSITENEIPMVFELTKIEELRINLRNTDPVNEKDYVRLYFYSDNMGFERVKSIENFGAENLKYEPPAFDGNTRLAWVGRNVTAVINGTILVNEALSIIVTIRKNGKLTEVIKRINGKRDKVNEIDIDY